jgi:hypothetical protein
LFYVPSQLFFHLLLWRHFSSSSFHNTLSLRRLLCVHIQCKTCMKEHIFLSNCFNPFHDPYNI